MAAGGRKSPTNHVTAKANLLATRLCHVAHSEITTSLGGRIALCIDPAAPTAATVVVPSASVYAVISAWPGVASRRVGRFDVWFRPQLRPSVRPSVPSLAGICHDDTPPRPSADSSTANSSSLIAFELVFELSWIEELSPSCFSKLQADSLTGD